MADNTVFSQQLPNIADPVSGGGEKLAAASVAQAKNTADLVGFLGNNAIEAYKGKLVADAQNKVLADLDKLQGYGAGAKEAEGQYNALLSKEQAANIAGQNTNSKILDATGKPAGTEYGPQMVRGTEMEDYMKEVDKLKSAYSQRILSKQDVMNRIASTVKEYSARMPGWAPEFRAAAAKYTGIDDFGTFQLHQYLKSNTTKEDHATKIMWQEKQNVMQEEGIIDPNAITQEMLDRHRLRAQAKGAVEKAEGIAKLGEIGGKELDKNSTLWQSGKFLEDAAETSGIWIDYRKANANADMSSADAHTFIRNKLGSMLDLQQQRHDAQIMQGVKSGLIRPEKQEEYLANSKKHYDALREMGKHEDGLNVMTSLFELHKGQAADLSAQFDIANPWVSYMGRLQALPAFQQLYLTNPEAMQKRFPDAFPHLDKAMKNAGASASLANSSTAVATGNASLAQVAANDKIQGTKHAALIFGSTEAGINDAANNGKPLDPKLVDKTVSDLKVYGTNLQVTDPQHMTSFNQKTAKSVIALANKLPPEQKKEALTPLAQTLDTGAKAVAVDMARLAHEQNATITLNKVTGQVSVAWPERGTWANIPVPGAGAGPDRRDNLQRVVNSFNTMVSTWEAIGPEVNDNYIKGNALPSLWQDYAGELKQRASKSNDETEERRQLAKKMTPDTVDPFGVMGGADLPVDQSGFKQDEVVQRLSQEAEAQRPDGAAANQGEVRKADNAAAKAGEVPGNNEGEEEVKPEIEQALKDIDNKYRFGGMFYNQIVQESGGDPDARSKAGAKGIAQFMDATAKDRGVKNVMDWKEALPAAAKYMVDLTNQFHGNPIMGIAAYNWGSGNLSKKGIANAPYETRAYVRKITGVDLWPEADIGKKVGGKAGATWQPNPNPTAAPWIQDTLQLIAEAQQKEADKLNKVKKA